MISVKFNGKFKFLLDMFFGKIVTFPLNLTVIITARGKVLIINCFFFLNPYYQLLRRDIATVP